MIRASRAAAPSCAAREQFAGEQRIYAYRDERFEAALSGGYQILPWLAAYAGWYGTLAGSESEPDQMAPPDSGPEPDFSPAGRCSGVWPSASPTSDQILGSPAP